MVSHTLNQDFIRLILQMSLDDFKAFLDLNIYDTVVVEQVENSCNKFFWTYNNQTYLYSGNYQTIIENNTTCDTIINLSLSILETNFLYRIPFTPNLDRKMRFSKLAPCIQLKIMKFGFIIGGVNNFPH